MLIIRPAGYLVVILTLLIFITIYWSHDAANLPPYRPRPFQAARARLRSPFAARWTTWFAPGLWTPIGSFGKGSGTITQDWNILHHLGGNGPWVQKIDDVAEPDVAPPEGCSVEQVHMLARHAERFPTTSSGEEMLDVVHRLQNSRVHLQGDLSFLKNWTFFSRDFEREMDQLTLTGPYSGSLGAFTTGVRLRSRYAHLLPHQSTRVKFWASGGERVEETAKYFGTGFFGLYMNESASLQIIPEAPERGGDSLTAGHTCRAYREDRTEGRALGDKRLEQFQKIYLKEPADRLREQLGETNLRFSHQEIYSMQEMCGFEFNVRGSSPWCDLFTKSEWESFEYARDLLHFYRTGPGNKYSPVIGTLWLKATSALLNDGPNAGKLFFSFAHDGDLIPVMTALDLFHDREPLPATHVAKRRQWRTSQLVPMGARLILERMSCRSPEPDSKMIGIFVRININDGIVAIPECQDGPGHSCKLDRFIDRLSQVFTQVGNFKEKCGLADDAPGSITFLHQ